MDIPDIGDDQTIGECAVLFACQRADCMKKDGDRGSMLVIYAMLTSSKLCVIYIYIIMLFFGPKLLSRLNGAMFPVRFFMAIFLCIFHCFLPWHIIQLCGCEISVAFSSPVFTSCGISFQWL